MPQIHSPTSQFIRVLIILHTKLHSSTNAFCQVLHWLLHTGCKQCDEGHLEPPPACITANWKTTTWYDGIAMKPRWRIALSQLHTEILRVTRACKPTGSEDNCRCDWPCRVEQKTLSDHRAQSWREIATVLPMPDNCHNHKALCPKLQAAKQSGIFEE